MKNLDFILGYGMAAFEDGADVAPEDNAAVVSPAAEGLLCAGQSEAEAIAREAREIAEENLGIIQGEAEEIEIKREQRNLLATAERMSTVAASMESFMDAGLSERTAGLLINQLNNVMGDVNKSATDVLCGDGMESMGDTREDMMRMLAVGLEALEEEKKGILGRLKDSVVKAFNTAANNWKKLTDKALRYKTRAGEIAKLADNATGAEIMLNNKSLLVKGGKTTTNIVADFTAFQKLAEAGVTMVLKRGTQYISSDAASFMNGLAKATTLKECEALLKKIKPLEVPGATVAVSQDKHGVTTRTEMVMGGYAIFQYIRKPEGNADKTKELVELADSFGDNWSDVHKAPFDDKVDANFAQPITAADVTKLCASVNVLMDMVSNTQKSVIPALDKSFNAWSAGAGKLPDNKATLEDGVKKVKAAAKNIPIYQLLSVFSVPSQVVRAAFSVTDAVLAVAGKAVKAKKAGKTEDDKGE